MWSHLACYLIHTKINSYRDRQEKILFLGICFCYIGLMWKTLKDILPDCSFSMQFAMIIFFRKRNHIRLRISLLELNLNFFYYHDLASDIQYPISRNHLNLPVSRPRGVWFRTSLYAWKFSQRYQPLRPDDIFVGYWWLQPIVICRSEGIIGFFTCNISHYITFIFQHQFLLKSFRPSLTMISLKINNVTFPIVLRAL